MKKVHKADMVAHLWANRSQSEARNAQGNFYFSGPTLYSYGDHFVCGHFMPDAYSVDGRPLVLVNAGSYSVTTTRHEAIMRNALHGVTCWPVPKLCGAMIYPASAGLVAESLIAGMRECALAAATSRRIKPETRSRHVRAAEVYAERARHLLIVDASRRDLPAHSRNAARAMLRTIPVTGAFPDLELASDGKEYAARCVALAQLVAREQARESLRVALATFANIAGKVDAYPAADDWSAIRTAATAVAMIGKAGDTFKSAEEHAKLGGARIPADVRRRLESLRARLPELETLAMREQRAQNVDLYRARVDAAREHLGTFDTWRFKNAIKEAREYAQACAALDTPEERDGRELELQELQAKQDQWAAASAADRVAQFLLFAEDDASAGRFPQAYTAIRNAYRAAKDGNLPEDGIADAAQRVAAAEESANAERIEAWRNGANVIVPRGDSPMLRLVGDEIQTSWGADVPATVARNLWRLVGEARRNKRGMTFDRGHMVGAFQLNQVTEDGALVIGCHTLEFSELERMARVMGFIKAEANA